MLIPPVNWSALPPVVATCVNVPSPASVIGPENVDVPFVLPPSALTPAVGSRANMTGLRTV